MNQQTQTNEERERAENAHQAERQIEGFGILGSTEWTNIPSIDYDGDNMNWDDLAERLGEQVLSVEVERTVRIVLCTGGPHCEVRWPENGAATIVCFGWFGAARFERPLTDEELSGIQNSLGDWDDLAGNDR